MRTCLAFISVLLCFSYAAKAQGQQYYPRNAGDKTESNILIEMPKGYVSGICVLVNYGDTISGAVINEFGITLMGFQYVVHNDKVKMSTVVAVIDKWYIEKTLANGIKGFLAALRNGESVFVDDKHNITFTLTPIKTRKDNDAQ